MLENILDMLDDQSLRGRCLEWMASMMCDIDYWPFGGPIHQQAHWARTLVLATQIASHEGLLPKDIDALMAAAAFHDTRRLSGGLDQGHGDRGAEHYREYCEAIGMEFDPRTYLAIKWHDRDDADGIAAIESWMQENPDALGGSSDGSNASAMLVYKILKDSDNLDRLRISLDALDMSYIRLPYSQTLWQYSHDMLLASQSEGTREGDAAGPDARRWLVVVDVQNDFVDAALGTPEAQAALPAMVEKAAGFEGNVVFTKDTHSTRYLDTSEGKKLPVPHCIAGGEGWQLVPQMQQVCDRRRSPVYLKGTFGSRRLADDILAAYARGNLESVEFIGLCTDICVISNALMAKAAVPELSISVDASCCAGVTPEKHEAALEAMRSCQIDVR